jgi:hypothetical protein
MLTCMVYIPPGNGRNRRNPVIAAHPGKGPFTIPLRTLRIACCQSVGADGVDGLHGLRFALFLELLRPQAGAELSGHNVAQEVVKYG